MKKQIVALAQALLHILRTPLVSIALKYGIGLGLVAWMIWSKWDVRDKNTGENIGISAVMDRTIEWQPFLLAFWLGTFSILLTFVRWYYLVRALDLPLSFYHSLRLGLFGFFASSFLPGSVTGDIPKAYYLAREQSRRTAAVATIIMDRGLGLCGLVWIVAILGVWFWFSGDIVVLARTPKATGLLYFIVQGSLGLVIGSLAFWISLGFLSQEVAVRLASRLQQVPKVGSALAELWRTVLMYRRRGKYVALCMILAMLGHIGFVIVFFLCSHTLNPLDKVPSLKTHFLIVPVGMTIQAGFPTPGGIGGGEAAFSFLYAQVGAQEGQGEQETEFSLEGLLASLFNRILFWLIAILGCAVWLFMKAPPAKVISPGVPAADANENGNCDKSLGASP